MMLVSSVFKYNEKPKAVPAKIDRHYAAAKQTGAVSPGGLMTFEIPTGAPGAFLKQSGSYLTTTVNNTTTGNNNNFRIVSTGHSFIQRARVLHGSNVISDINNYNMWASIMYDMTTGPAYSNSLGMAGRETAPIVVNSVADINLGVSADIPVANCRFGVRVDRAGSATSSVDLALPLIGCGPLDPNETTYLPLHDLQGNLILEFTLSDTDTPIIRWGDGTAAVGANFGTTARTWTLTNSNLVYSVLYLDYSIMETIKRVRGSAGGSTPHKWQSHGWFNFSTGATGATDNMTLPFNTYSSLESLIFTYRANAAATQLRNSLARSTCGLTEFNFDLSGKNLLTLPIKGIPEMFMEARKVFAGVGDREAQFNIARAAYQRNGYATDGAFVAGVSLDSVSEADPEKEYDVSHAGVDVRGKTLVLRTTNAGGAASTLHVYARFGLEYIVDNGLLGVNWN